MNASDWKIEESRKKRVNIWMKTPMIIYFFAVYKWEFLNISWKQIWASRSIIFDKSFSELITKTIKGMLNNTETLAKDNISHADTAWVLVYFIFIRFS